MPGYRLSNADKQTIAEIYICGYCLLLLKDVVQTSCGHFYCHSCVVKLIQDVKMCLKDQIHLRPNEFFPDGFIRREVLALIVHCTFMDEGCIWKGEVRHLENHTSGCEFLKILCSQCGVPVKKGDLKEHLENACMYRLQICGFCKRSIPLIKLKFHQENDCPAYPFMCNRYNKDCAPRRRLADHQNQIMGDCKGFQGPCPFSRIGCSKEEVLNQTEKKEYLKQGNIHDSVLVPQFHKKLEAIARGQEQSQYLPENRAADLEIRSVENPVRMDSIEQRVARSNVFMSYLAEYARRQEGTSYDGKLLWKISDFSRRQNLALSGDELSFHSPCFYTSRSGYKMCARIHLNGEGEGKGTHISLSFIVMLGENDAQLRWPFKQKVTFMLLDQNDVKHVIKVLRPNPTGTSFRRSGTGAEIAGGFRCPLFCSLAELINHAYVREDNMFLEIIVDTSDQ